MPPLTVLVSPIVGVILMHVSCWTSSAPSSPLLRRDIAYTSQTCLTVFESCVIALLSYALLHPEVYSLQSATSGPVHTQKIRALLFAVVLYTDQMMKCFDGVLCIRTTSCCSSKQCHKCSVYPANMRGSYRGLHQLINSCLANHAGCGTSISRYG